MPSHYKMIKFQPSPFEKRVFRGREFYIKRDDLLHPDFSGNKARKFTYFLKRDFPGIKRIVSYGSNQSNAMYSLSVLAKMRGWEFVYFCNHIPQFLKETPVGNYKEALKNGMKIYESKDRRESANSLKDECTLVVQEGGRQKEAEEGIEMLADELKDDIKREGIEKPYVYLPSGTGTTALFLQKHLPYEVYTCSTVGSDDYLKEQFGEIGEMSYFPKILSSKKRYHYGKLYIEAYEIYKELKSDMGVEFDLMYDAIGWLKFLENIENIDGMPVYIHQGGILGNISMLQRYKRKYGKIVEN